MEQQENIFTYFAQQAGCYESDLRLGNILFHKKFILNIPEYRFSLTQWNLLLGYITGTCVQYRSIAQAKKMLIRRCTRQ